MSFLHRTFVCPTYIYKIMIRPHNTLKLLYVLDGFYQRVCRKPRFEFLTLYFRMSYTDPQKFALCFRMSLHISTKIMTSTEMHFVLSYVLHVSTKIMTCPHNTIKLLHVLYGFIQCPIVSMCFCMLYINLRIYDTSF